MTNDQDQDCPACGCDGTTAGQRDRRWGRPFTHQRCEHCGHEWQTADFLVDSADSAEGSSAAEAPKRPGAVIWHVIRCPKCGSEKTRVARTMRPIRYHKCKDCRHSFKSVEGR